MAANAIEAQSVRSIAPVLVAVEAEADDSVARQLPVERALFRSAVIGALIGAVVCAGLWVMLMAIALAGDNRNFWPMLAVGAGCGVFAGIFLGGCAGTLIGASRLEHHEHDILP